MSGLRALLGVVAGAAIGLVALSGCASGVDATRTPSPPTSDAQSGELLQSCLAESGWTTTIAEDGGLVAEYPTEQHDRYVEDLRACTETLGLDSDPELSADQYEYLYAGLLEAQRCLLDEFGYATPKAPSKQTFIELMGGWSPFNLLPDLSAEEFAEIQEVCPQPSL